MGDVPCFFKNTLKSLNLKNNTNYTIQIPLDSTKINFGTKVYLQYFSVWLEKGERGYWISTIREKIVVQTIFDYQNGFFVSTGPMRREGLDGDCLKPQYFLKKGISQGR